MHQQRAGDGDGQLFISGGGQGSRLKVSGFKLSGFAAKFGFLPGVSTWNVKLET
jgi:hypothetical protein